MSFNWVFVYGANAAADQKGCTGLHWDVDLRILDPCLATPPRKPQQGEGRATGVVSEVALFLLSLFFPTQKFATLVINFLILFFTRQNNKNFPTLVINFVIVLWDGLC